MWTKFEPRSFTVIVLVHLLGLLVTVIDGGGKYNTYNREKLHKCREEVREMFRHAYDSYLYHAYPYDELRPLTCDGVDTWGSYSLTLIDALDTLAVMGNYTEFSRVYHLVAERKDFDANINVSVFETNIRIVGGLISAHLLAKKAGVPLEDGWPCAGPLLRLAEDAADRLLPAFNTASGMPYGTVNLRHGVPEGETPITCTAGVGTFIVEFGALSRLTGNPVYEETALRALRAIWSTRSTLDLLGNHIDVQKGRWTAVEAGIGAGVDSFFEYLVKGSSLLGRPELRAMFNQARKPIDHYLRKDDWHFWVAMKNGQVTLPLFQSLEAFWPGMLSMVGDVEQALKSLHNYHQVWKQFGFTPEFYNVAQGAASAGREGYPLRPELIESIMYLYRATGDPWLVDAGVDILKSIQHSAYTPCGYATVRNAKTHTLDNRMESFFLAETVKYLYLLFDPDNFIHNTGATASIHTTKHGRCVLDAGGYIFNTEAHPIDPAALACCHNMPSEKEITEELTNNMIDLLDPYKVKMFRGELIPERLKRIQLEKIQAKQDKTKMEEKVLTEKLMRLKREMLAFEEEERLKAEEAQGQSIPGKVISLGTAEPIRTDSSQSQESAKSTSNQSEGAASISSQSQQSSGQASSQLESITTADITLETSTEYYKSRGEDGEGENYLSDDPQFNEETDIDNKDDSQQTSDIGPAMQKFSSGDSATGRSSGGIVQPEKMPNMFEPAKPNKIVETLNNLLERFATPKNYKFDMMEYTTALMSDKRFSLNQSWYKDYSVLTCPGTKFTDRFLIHGEFFTEDP